jgi:hypothetical protein
MIHALKIVTITASDHSFQIAIDGETTGTMRRATSDEIHRYKGPRIQNPAGGPKRDASAMTSCQPCLVSLV